MHTYTHSICIPFAYNMYIMKLFIYIYRLLNINPCILHLFTYLFICVWALIQKSHTAGHLHPMGSDSFLSLTSMFFLLPCTSMSLTYHSQGVCHIVEVESRFSDVQAVVRSGSESLCHNAWHKLQSLSLRGMFEYVKRVAFFNSRARTIESLGFQQIMVKPGSPLSELSWLTTKGYTLLRLQNPVFFSSVNDYFCHCPTFAPLMSRWFRAFYGWDSGFFVEMRFRATKKEASQGRQSHGRKLAGSGIYNVHNVHILFRLIDTTYIHAQTLINRLNIANHIECQFYV